MSGLVAFADGGGKGLQLPQGIFAWNNGGSGGALDLHDYAMSGDVGYYPDWVNNTRLYLAAGSHSDVNVVMWSWCGQVDSKYAAGRLFSEYLTPMSELEEGLSRYHVRLYDRPRGPRRRQRQQGRPTRSFATIVGPTNKVLYDFADIESFDPDGTYHPFPHDSCEYYSALNGQSAGQLGRAVAGQPRPGRGLVQL